jgi:hypothetical protein
MGGNNSRSSKALESYTFQVGCEICTFEGGCDGEPLNLINPYTIWTTSISIYRANVTIIVDHLGSILDILEVDVRTPYDLTSSDFFLAYSLPLQNLSSPVLGSSSQKKGGPNFNLSDIFIQSFVYDLNGYGQPSENDTVPMWGMLINAFILNSGLGKFIESLELSPTDFLEPNYPLQTDILQSTYKLCISPISFTVYIAASAGVLLLSLTMLAYSKWARKGLGMAGNLL